MKDYMCPQGCDNKVPMDKNLVNLSYYCKSCDSTFSALYMSEQPWNEIKAE